MYRSCTESGSYERISHEAADLFCVVASRTIVLSTVAQLEITLATQTSKGSHDDLASLARPDAPYWFLCLLQFRHECLRVAGRWYPLPSAAATASPIRITANCGRLEALRCSLPSFRRSLTGFTELSVPFRNLSSGLHGITPAKFISIASTLRTSSSRHWIKHRRPSEGVSVGIGLCPSEGHT